MCKLTFRSFMIIGIGSKCGTIIKTRQLQIMPVSIACAHCHYPIDIQSVSAPSDVGINCKMCGKTSYVINAPS
uniref:Putative ZnF protein n=1 Tax=Aedes anphevirus TaxID=2230910 RepID=A0A2Z4HFE0_9MONO|nr:putative ZnF protein [Aedes anphevirus]AWW13456.1 putative ZnF protein [Aedes anphevirus]AWW13477.1 putative ZnF protein [Aedes anphevirus]AWW13505.1 putative ZnF protein [Aedes anphevirus]